jgi:membrane protein
MEEDGFRLQYLWAPVIAWATFAREDVWRVRLQGLPWWQRIAYGALRVALLAARGFKANQGPLRASALTFYTLLSIVPVAAMAFGIAQGFGFQKMLERELYQNFPGQEQIVGQVVRFAQSMLETTKGGLVAGIGLVLLFWSVVKVLGSIEASFNAIWRVERPRTLMRKFSDYLTIVLISPVLVILAGSTTVFVSTQIAFFLERLSLPAGLETLIALALKLMPYTFVWVLFTMIYMVMPNTRVRFSWALGAGILAGTVYQLVQWGFITFQVGAARASAIYGSFSALPLFLVWLQLSWMIVLMGAEVSCAAQKARQWEPETDDSRASPAQRKLAALVLCREVVHAFVAGGAPLSAKDLAERTRLPGGLVHKVLGELVDSGVLNRICQASNEDYAYLPSRDTDRITLGFVVQALDRLGTGGFSLPAGPTMEPLGAAYEALERAMEAAPENRSLKDF